MMRPKDKSARPSARKTEARLALGVAHRPKLARAIANDQSLAWNDASVGATLLTYRIRKEIEGTFGSAGEAVARPLYVL